MLVAARVGCAWNCHAVGISGSEDGRAQDLSGPQLGENVVGLYKRECSRLGPDSGLGSNFQEIQPILAREVGNRDQLSLSPEEIVWKARNVTHVNPCAYHPAALAYRAQRRRNQLSDRSVDD